MVADETGEVTYSADRSTYDEATRPLRGELVAYAYRFLGSWDDAEDAVQNTLLQAWRGWDRFENRSSVKTWLYRIATNACLDITRDRRRRTLPPEAKHPSSWIQPAPIDRDDVRLALVVTLQSLPPTQRAVFLLRAILGLPASEVADLLDTTVAAIKSSLQRARARIADAAPVPDDVVEPRAETAQRLLSLYMSAFENGEVERLLTVLRADTTLELMPQGDQFAGKTSCAQVLAAAVGRPGDWRMQPAVANGQPAALVWLHAEPYGVAVLDTREDGIDRITVFADPALVAKFTRR